MTGYYVRAHTERGGFVSNGKTRRTYADAVTHAQQLLANDRGFVGCTIMHERRPVAAVYPDGRVEPR